MLEYNLKCEPDRGLRATRDEYEALVHVLYPKGEDYDGDDFEYTGFWVDYDNGEVYVFAQDPYWEALPDAFLPLLGSLIEKNALEYLEFGVTIDFIGDSLDATPFRVRSDGSIWQPTLTWTW